ncbi:DUF2171 domain-containing protein [Methylobacterium planeticum]|uniref:DUF2171 domain-containing protein n=1 Tax=Methylobacterium planeticum TaxID=2615211 RepID=A0A6N6MTU6_9HYPH|nr:DUF2171 domain-containing protein [Methylobacterium planeticum]KAB1074057.1 DUF2171 domain-containing protein [Methylobacterium planeticum]
MIQEQMPVVGSDGGHVGTVDHLEDQRIKPTKTDPDAQGRHHCLHVDSIAAIADGVVRLNLTAPEAEDEEAVAH